MKNLIFFLFISALFFACKGNTETGTASTEAKSDTTKSSAITYPYTMDKPHKDWEIGNQENVVISMKGLKAFEDGDIPGTVSYFGDSTELYFDGYKDKLSNADLTKFFTNERSKYNNVKVKMQDWVSVISKDKEHEWVTLWYKQINTMKDGTVDSLSVIDDLKIKNGKVVILDEKVQKFPAPKK